MKNKIEEQSRRLNAERRAAEGRATDARPPRFAVGDYVMTNALSGHRNRRGLITEVGMDGTEYRVEFEDGLRPTTTYLMAKWLKR